MKNIRAHYNIIMQAHGSLSYWEAKKLADTLEPVPGDCDQESFIQNKIDTSKLLYAPSFEGPSDDSEKQEAPDYSEVEKVWGRLGAAVADINDMAFKKQALIESENNNPADMLSEEEADNMLLTLTGILHNHQISPMDDPRTTKLSLDGHLDLTKTELSENGLILSNPKPRFELN